MRYKLRGFTSRPPKYGSKEAAGIDLYYNGDKPVAIKPGEIADLETRLSVEIPKGCFGMVVVRSGLGRKGLDVLHSAGIIDSDYRGEIGVRVINRGKEKITILPKTRAAQMVIMPYLTVDLERAEELSETERGDGGFGSTGER